MGKYWHIGEDDRVYETCVVCSASEERNAINFLLKRDVKIKPERNAMNKVQFLYHFEPGQPLMNRPEYGCPRPDHGIYQEAKVRLHDTDVLDLLVVRGHFLGSERKRVLDLGLAQLSMGAHLGSRIGGLILVARRTGLDALQPRLIDFPRVYEVEVLESNLISLD